MNIDNIEKYIKWEKYYDPNFDWNDRTLYSDFHLSDNFLSEFQNKVNWRYVSAFQFLSEDTVRKFAKKVDWSNIITFQRHLNINFMNMYFTMYSNYKKHYSFSDIYEYGTSKLHAYDGEYQDILSKRKNWKEKEVI